MDEFETDAAEMLITLTSDIVLEADGSAHVTAGAPPRPSAR